MYLFAITRSEKQDTMYSLLCDHLGIVDMGKSDVTVIVLNKEKKSTSRFEL